MRKKEVGQALILVLIFLAIGSLLTVPALSLTDTCLRSSRVVTRDVKALVTADAAQEYVAWKLLYDDLGSQFTDENPEITLSFELNDVSVDISVIRRAVESEGACVFATQHVIRPTKTAFPDTVPNDTINTHTYTIKLEQLSPDTTRGLDTIYDVLPKGFDPEDYVSGSSYSRTDGSPWQSIPDPLIEVEGNQVRMQWPASGNFTSPMRDFQLMQVKEIKYEVTGQLAKNSNHASWLVLKPWNTLSGPTGIITVGSPDPPDCMEDGMIQVYATSNPQVIQPGVEQGIEYTIHITNLENETLSIMEVKDWLPQGFTYTDNSTSGITTYNPQLSLENLNDQDRWLLHWAADEFPSGTVSIASGETLTLTFRALTSKDASGTYYSEIMVIPDKPVPSVIKNIGVTREEYVTNYTWNTGAVIVPAYDSQTTALDTTIDANIGLVEGGIVIKSWHIE